MPQSDNNPHLVEMLLMDVIKRLDLVSEKVDEKVDVLEGRLTQQNSDLRKAFSDRVDHLQDQINVNTAKVQKHEHYFSFLIYLVTGGAAAIVGALAWVSDIFKAHK